MQPDGHVILEEGDGNVLAFDVSPEGSFLPPVGYPFTGPLALATDDLDGDGHLDLAIPLEVDGEVAVMLGDGQKHGLALVKCGNIVLKRTLDARIAHGELHFKPCLFPRGGQIR